MTGPAHYREAERLIRQANSIKDGFPGDEYAQTIAEAQVHATLATAAAFVDTMAVMRPEERDEWDRVTGRLSDGPEVTR